MPKVHDHPTLEGMWWTWNDRGVVHMTIGDRGRYQAMMRQVVCLGSWIDLLHAVSGTKQHANCIACLGARRVGP